ncbi:hypothetical protein GOBAR_DD36916 [Gossypium barbadense]|nr:hypothetical protein GOBAR_DD36916 [Gossypium barbadense]
MECGDFSTFYTLMGQLPKVTWFRLDLYNWEGFWYVGDHLPGAMDAKSNFQAKDDDLLLTSSVKTGTTWLKAIIPFPTIMNPKGRKDDGSDDPSLKHHPNELTPSLELGFYKIHGLSRTLTGPFHDHVLGSWRESIKRPEMIYFMRNEDMKKDPKGEVKKLACFLGRPFEKEEEVEKVLWRCSLDRLKNLEVNQHGIEPWSGVGLSGTGGTTSLMR